MSKILIVDDEYAVCLLYQEELTFEGYEVITASDCEGLMETIAQQRPDLIVLDIKIGEVNGLDILQNIRNTYYNLPVILCTAYPAFKYDLKSVAADYYVVKSADLSELKHKIKTAMERRVQLPSQQTS
jgi:two-component system response regulator (stage 0 sporulation protein F)